MPIPLPVIVGTFRCALSWGPTGAGLTAVNVMHIRSTVGGVGASDIMEALDDAVTAAMWSTLASAWACNDVAITPLDGISPTQHFTPATPAHWTGGTGGDVAPQVAAILKMVTTKRGRANRGRLFLPGPAEAQTTAGHINDGTDVTATAAWQAFNVALFADPDVVAQVVVASYDRKHAGAGAHANDVVHFVVENVLATQRRRQTRLRP